MNTVPRVFKRFWFSSAIIAAVAGVQAITYLHPAAYSWLREHFATNLDTVVRGQLYRLLASPFFQSRPGFVITIVALVCSAVPLAEWRIGSWRAAATFFVGDLVSTLVTLLVLGFAGHFGVARAAEVAARPDSGSSSGAFACAAAVAMSARPAMRTPMLTVLGGWLVYRLVVFGGVSDCQHLLAAIVGGLGQAPVAVSGGLGWRWGLVRPR